MSFAKINDDILRTLHAPGPLWYAGILLAISALAVGDTERGVAPAEGHALDGVGPRADAGDELAGHESRGWKKGWLPIAATEVSCNSSAVVSEFSRPRRALPDIQPVDSLASRLDEFEDSRTKRRPPKHSFARLFHPGGALTRHWRDLR